MPKYWDMHYNLKFIKISKKHRFAGVGFGGNIFIVLNMLTRMGINDELHVDMETNECACTEKNVVLHNTKNCWEYYFDQQQLSGEITMQLDSLLSGHLTYDSKMFLSPESFKDLREKFYLNFKLKPYLKEAINEFYESTMANKTTLGVQVRLTDMKQHHNVPSLDEYVNRINVLLDNEPSIEQIFLATDDNKVIPKLEKCVNVPIIYYNDMYRADDVKLHLHPYDRFEVDRDLHRYKLGVECIKEIITLSKCNYLLKAHTSAISMVACVLSENIKKIYTL